MDGISHLIQCRQETWSSMRDTDQTNLRQVEFSYNQMKEAQSIETSNKKTNQKSQRRILSMATIHTHPTRIKCKILTSTNVYLAKPMLLPEANLSKPQREKSLRKTIRKSFRNNVLK